MPLLASSISDFFFEWYPVFGVVFMAGLLAVFIVLLRQTMGSTKPEIGQGEPDRDRSSGRRCRGSTPPRRS